MPSLLQKNRMRFHIVCRSPTIYPLIYEDAFIVFVAFAKDKLKLGGFDLPHFLKILREQREVIRKSSLEKHLSSLLSNFSCLFGVLIWLEVWTNCEKNIKELRYNDVTKWEKSHSNKFLKNLLILVWEENARQSFHATRHVSKLWFLPT